MNATTIDELCHTLGLRTPMGVMIGAHAQPSIPDVAAVSRLSDEELTALGVLAAPEAIAVVTQWPTLQRFAPPVPVIHVIATRGPWLAEHVIEGDAHHLHAADAENAAVLLLDRSGFVETDDPTDRLINVTLAAYHRMIELVRAGDHRRARAALIADGANPDASDGLITATQAGRIDVAGLSADGRRFIGCDLAVAGDAETGRWTVPTIQHVDAVPKHTFRHPSYGALSTFGATSGNVRVLIERIGTADLQDELALIFGDV